MKQEQYCKPEDMIRFLLAICCQDDSSATPVSRGDVPDARLNEFLNGVAKIAESEELKAKLED
jgi:hypothetical protein